MLGEGLQHRYFDENTIKTHCVLLCSGGAKMQQLLPGEGYHENGYKFKSKCLSMFLLKFVSDLSLAIVHLFAKLSLLLLNKHFGTDLYF